jgi:hypothetical protein
MLFSVSDFEYFSRPTPGRFIIGECPDSSTEYVVHLEHPRFIAKFNDGNEETFASAVSRAEVVIDDCIFYDIQWIDEEPDPGMQIVLLVEADAAIERCTWKQDPDEDYCFDDDF